MLTDHQLRQRAEAIRQQLQVTMRQTRDAIIGSMELIDHIARCRERESFGRSFPPTIGNVDSALQKLDALRLLECDWSR